MNTITIQAGKVVAEQGSTLPAQIRMVLPGSTSLTQNAIAADTLLIPDLVLPLPTQRLIVLVPAGDIDEIGLVHRVWELAASSNLMVLYLALSPDADQVSYQRRRLVGLAALTTDIHVRAGTGVYFGNNWSAALRQALQPGDLVTCLAEDYVPGLFKRRKLGEWLVAHLGVPVYELGNLKVNAASSSTNRIKNLLIWIAAPALIVAFFWLQVAIDQALSEPLSTILLCLSVVVELYSILKINDWIG